MTAYDIIKRPIITEQSMADTEMKRYTFEVAKSANKIEIAKAVEEIFGVKVAKVNTLNMQGKEKRTGRFPAGRRPSWKKAMVTLTEDSAGWRCPPIPRPSSSSRAWCKEEIEQWLLRLISPQRPPAVT